MISAIPSGNSSVHFNEFDAFCVEGINVDIAS
jgi:hypothetical protein